MKHENIKGKIYVSSNAYLGHSETFCRGFQTAIYRPNWGARPHLGATRPRVGIANLGFDAPSWQYLTDGYSCICKSRPRALTYKCRRGDEAADKIAFYRVKVFLFELF